MRILLRRIQIAEENAGLPTRDFKSIYDSWFMQKLNGREPANYILDFGWAKPRDIVRLILCAQKDSLHNNDTTFSKAVFDTIKRSYSKSSLEEITQELNALYSTQQITEIKRMFLGRTVFRKYSDIIQSARSMQFQNTIWQLKPVDDILDDLFRIGFIGNYRKVNKKGNWRWRHKGDQELLKDEKHNICVHNALNGELAIISTGGRYGFSYDNTDRPEEQSLQTENTDISLTCTSGRHGFSNDNTIRLEEQPLQTENADISLTCIECGGVFVFSTGEQEFYQKMGFQNRPLRCSNCRKKRKQSTYHEAVCALCGGKAVVPFIPSTQRILRCLLQKDKRKGLILLDFLMQRRCNEAAGGGAG